MSKSTLNTILFFMLITILVIVGMTLQYVVTQHYNENTEYIPIITTIESEQSIEYISWDVTVTAYQPLPSQCDDTPYLTADGSNIRTKDSVIWCAVSRDLMHWIVNFEDTIVLEIYDKDTITVECVVHDVTNLRLQNTVDILITNSDKPYKHNGKIKEIRR